MSDSDPFCKPTFDRRFDRMVPEQDRARAMSTRYVAAVRRIVGRRAKVRALYGEVTFPSGGWDYGHTGTIAVGMEQFVISVRIGTNPQATHASVGQVNQFGHFELVGLGRAHDTDEAIRVALGEARPALMRAAA